MTRLSKVNYDALANTYAQRYQANKLPGVARALKRLARRIRAQRILEVGCGTGRWLAEFQSQPWKITGLDLSLGMLRQAQKASQTSLACGQAEQLPFPSRTLDMIFCVNAFHHLSEPQSFIQSAYRSLRPGGALAVIGMDPHRQQDRWVVYDYFEGTRELDLQRFPSGGVILDWMARAGFQKMEWQVVHHIHDPLTGPAVLESPFLQKNGTSQLVLISDAAYQGGIEKIRQALAKPGGEDRIFPSDIDLAMLVGLV